MWRRIRSALSPKAESPAPINALRDRLAILLALVTLVGLGAAFILSKGTQVLMPGPLASAHGGIETCSACHTKSGTGKLSWVHGLVAGDPAADSKACLTCHKMPDTAFNAHGASADVLTQSTKRLAKIAAETPQPQSARAQNIAFPTDEVVSRDLYCATCHQEHQGINFNLSKISNEQCQSCHVVKFDSFDGHHPKFETYPFKRRTRIIYDHAGHFGKHYPDVAKKDPARRIPDTCSTCHDSRDDKRVMSVAPFEKTCTGCHLDQIVGKERVSGPKGVAFLSLPGLDVATLKKKNASIGDWPDASDAALTPFMKLMISRDERGRTLIKTVDSLNLQDLTKASDDQIKAVTTLAWEIKRLFYALIKGKASDVLGDFNVGGGAKLSTALVADLTASLPRDVIVGAQQQWLPNLATEMVSRSNTRDQSQSGWSAVTTEPNSKASSSQEKQLSSDAPPTTAKRNADAAERETPPSESGSTRAEPTNSSSNETEASEKKSASDTEAAGREEPAKAKLDPPVCTVRLFGQCLVSNEPADKGDEPEAAEKAKLGAGQETHSARKLSPPMRAGIKFAENTAQSEGAAGEVEGGPIIRRWSLPGGTSRTLEGRDKESESKRPANTKADDKKSPSADKQPRAIKTETKDTEKPAQTEGPAAPAETSKADASGANETPSVNKQPQGKGADQTDDLLFPTEEELRAMKAGNPDGGKAAEPQGAAGKADAASAAPHGEAEGAAASKTGAEARAAAPVISIESDIDPESWAEYGGWYRQDYTIFYRPTGHKDKFIYSWLFLTGPQSPKGATSPAASVFDLLTSKDAQGSCTKCHSVDDIQGKGRIVNFSPPKVDSKQGRFTTFIHEPHFGILESRAGSAEKNRGCLSCHELEKDRPYLKSYEQGNPQSFVSNFGDVKRDLCQTCHTSTMARQDCLLCHTYHVNGVVTPIMSTKLPTQ
ncbi:hypothetical protein [Hyphomicrobium sp.]|uniref:hypothetical protein n=1 Tax=Hyphomicrobium sp. TaxID=82 RepID=UPI002E35976B|nr:hypothetical protein [Hyphomicrobium sp.]HEX2841686.1 hypothetical protein [Hyphomicrobium sp.]